jgi:DNA-binding NarL/FixJ family response regulator
VQQRILLAEDHPLFREALRSAILRRWPQFEVQAARQALSNGQFGLVILDLKLPDSDGFMGLLALRGEFPRTSVVVVSASEDATTVSYVIASGAQGFIPKSAPLSVISDALEAILNGDVWAPEDIMLGAPSKEFQALASLSPAQARIVACLRRGLFNKQIAFELGLAENTVKVHMTAAFKKLGVASRTQALIFLQAMSLEPPAGG